MGKRRRRKLRELNERKQAQESKDILTIVDEIPPGKIRIKHVMHAGPDQLFDRDVFENAIGNTFRFNRQEEQISFGILVDYKVIEHGFTVELELEVDDDSLPNGLGIRDSSVRTDAPSDDGVTSFKKWEDPVRGSGDR